VRCGGGKTRLRSVTACAHVRRHAVQRVAEQVQRREVCAGGARASGNARGGGVARRRVLQLRRKEQQGGQGAVRAQRLAEDGDRDARLLGCRRTAFRREGQQQLAAQALAADLKGLGVKGSGVRSKGRLAVRS